MGLACVYESAQERVYLNAGEESRTGKRGSKLVEASVNVLGRVFDNICIFGVSSNPSHLSHGVKIGSNQTLSSYLACAQKSCPYLVSGSPTH
jgi:hypothetical protein